MEKKNIIKGFSVIMPTYNQSAFILRAIQSLKNQTFKDWELIIINDGCTDDTEIILENYLSDPKIKYIRNSYNEGLGFSLNRGIEIAKYEYIAYLPSDDYYYETHLETLNEKFESELDIFLVFSGIKYNMNDSQYTYYDIENVRIRNYYPLQLVQTAHRKDNEKWLERKDLVTDDLFLMYWNKLSTKGTFAFTEKITCFWTQHPHQRHKFINENLGGGLNTYRRHYNVKDPLRIRISEHKLIDENVLYQPFRKINPVNKNALKILLVGELAFNPERVCALEEAGHKLYGLWIDSPSSFNTVGPLPFGNIQDLPSDNYQKAIADIKPDIIYALLNFKAVPLAYHILKDNRNIPFVWHFKEGPNFCMQTGTWDKLIYLYKYADGKIYINETAKDWYEQFFSSEGLTFILDGDLPKKDYFFNDFSQKLSSNSGSVHTLVAGRMIGITPVDFEYLAKEDIHIHLYTENYFKSRESQIASFKKIAPDHFHVHPHCTQLDWVKEFSKYDAGWLHSFESLNKGNLNMASWDDLNIPAKINTYVAAGIPMIMRDNGNNIVATQRKIKELDIGILFENYADLTRKLKDCQFMTNVTNNVLRNRESFTFDYHVPELISFFREVIKHKKNCNE